MSRLVAEIPLEEINDGVIHKAILTVSLLISAGVAVTKVNNKALNIEINIDKDSIKIYERSENN